MGRIIDPVDAYVDDNRARLNPIPRTICARPTAAIKTSARRTTPG